jgi:thiosulfate dehydrogenase
MSRGLVAGVIAAAMLGGTVFLVARTATTAAAADVDATVEYGGRLLRETAKLIGPDQADPALRYAGSRLNCSSCHFDGGAVPGTLSLRQTASRYPRPSPRDGGVRDLRDRINGCMLRSMNGRALPRDGAEMIAMEKYIQHLGEQPPTGSPQPPEQAPFKEPDRAADPEAGRAVYAARCTVCHGAEGLGLLTTGKPSDGYTFPPLWGADSFNDGAGMHRVLTAATFIKARMPLGQADLTDDQAFDVAAFINSQPRPAMQGLERDYPDLAAKPVDNPYPPYVDPFPQERHVYGPFKEIRAWYAARKASQPGAQ